MRFCILHFTALLTVSAFACSRPSPEPSQGPPRSPASAGALHVGPSADPVGPPAPASSAAQKKMGAVLFQLPTGAKKVKVEVVNSPATIERGLMFRQHMAPDDGMLFLMPNNAVHTFWMHNTLIPLDMLFITKELTVTGIIENAEPQTDTLRTVNKMSQYVLEMNGGWCKANGVSEGTKMVFADLEAAAK